LIVKNTVWCRYGVFKVPWARALSDVVSARGAAPEGGLSKLNSVEAPRSTFVLGEPAARRCQAHTRELRDELGAYRGNRPSIPRKEVIQPQLPLRLPCYDFTPVTDPTFDGSLPLRG